MTISYRRVLDPMLVIGALFGVQFISWFLFFPEQPSVIDGEPRYDGVLSVAIFLLMAFFLFSGMAFGKLLGKGSFLKVSLDKRACLHFAWVIFFFALGANLIRFFSVLGSFQDLLSIFEPHGINRLHARLSDSVLGLASISILWLLPAIIASLLFFRKADKGNAWLLLLICLLVLFYSIFNMARTAFFVLVSVLFAAYAYERRSRFSLVGLFFICVILFGFYWINALLRTGVVFAEINGLELYSFEVQYRVFQEYIEKYIAGELNNTFIIMTYAPDPLVNYAYGTLFHAYTDAYAPPHYLNTLNVLGFWYWQFGVLGGAGVSFMVGALLGFFFKRAMSSIDSCNIPASAVIYLMLYSGFISITRINYYFLSYFFLSAVLFFVLLVFLFLQLQAKIAFPARAL